MDLMTCEHNFRDKCFIFGDMQELVERDVRETRGCLVLMQSCSGPVF